MVSGWLAGFPAIKSLLWKFLLIKMDFYVNYLLIDDSRDFFILSFYMGISRPNSEIKERKATRVNAS